MIYSTIIFCVIIVLYHIISIITLHTRGYEYITTLSILRDLGRGAIITITLLYHYKHILPFLHKRKYPFIMAMLTIGLSIGLSKRQGASRYNIFIGVKYGYMFLGILLSALFVGRTLSKEQKEKITTIVPKIVVTTIIIGLIRQMAKYIWPDFFFNIGYGQIGDFVFGQEPPIYYRTGPGGEPRLQGLFAGPNNYGYFLAAFFPILLYQYKKYTTNNAKLLRSVIIIIVVTSIILTLSRTAMIGAVIGTILVYKTRFIQHKKIFVTGLIVATISIIGLSIFKGGSTQEHIQNKRSSIQHIIEKPLGYGLGTAGPAIHHEGTILPENYYIQMAIDTGTLGFILLMLTLISIIRTQRYNRDKENELYALHIGFFVLLVMGLFLHVFEDSMVNYLFFITRGIAIGYASANQKT